jgi:outer membrane protein, heavy metal efflux system
MFLEGADPGRAVGFVGGVSVPLPFFEHGQGPRARGLARAELARAHRAQLLRATQLELQAGLEALEKLRERRDRQRTDVVARADELRAIALAAYRGGAQELWVLVDAERTAREAALDAVGLDHQLREAEIDVAFLAGADDGEESKGP